MNMLANLATSNDIADEKDSVGSGGVQESGLYPGKVALAYIQKAASEALGLVVIIKGDNGKDIKQTFWMTSGKAKGGTNYYTDKSGAKQYLPGFNQANSLALLTTGKEIGQLETETKVVNVYSSEAKAEVPTKVEVFTEMLGQEIITGLIKQTVDKTQKDDNGVYQPTGETREENEVDKFFRAKDSMTTSEIRAQATEAVFIGTWEAKWAGKSKDKSTKGAGTAGAPKPAGAAGASTKPKNSLFA